MMKYSQTKKVRFSELDGENRLAALTQMLNFKIKNDWPYGATWQNEEDIKTDINKDYNPDEHFSFYLGEKEAVITTIG